jgi:2-amino-4-hydroxy-6-hydroxymethyldihydropteridine diphosphokinase
MGGTRGEMSTDARATVLVALGSNLGGSAENIRRAFDALRNLSPEPIRRSSLWQSTPVDCPPDSPLFVNAAVGLDPLPGETPESLLLKLQELETAFGRKPRVVFNEPRPLDLDLIAFGAKVRNTPELILPHPRAHLRRFVLQPLAEIAPGTILPGQTRTIAQLLAALRSSESVTPLRPAR